MLYVFNLWLPSFSGMFIHSCIYLPQASSHIDSNTFQEKKNLHFLILLSPSFLILISSFTSSCPSCCRPLCYHCFHFCVLAYLSDLLSNCVFLFSTQILSSFLFREDLSVFPLGQVWYYFILLVSEFLRNSFSLSTLNHNLAGQNILVCKYPSLQVFLFQDIEYILLLPSGLQPFLQINQLIALQGSFVIKLFFSCCLQTTLFFKTYLFFFFFFLEYNGCTIFCWSLPHINMNQPQVYICAISLEPSSTSHPSQHSRLESSLIFKF